MGVDRVLKKPLEDDDWKKVEEDFLGIQRDIFWKKFAKEKESLKDKIMKDLKKEAEEDEKKRWLEPIKDEKQLSTIYRVEV